MARYAAIDIGSNSIRMQVAEVVPGAPNRILAAEREVTRLGESVFRNGRLSEEAITLACAVLERMAAAMKPFEVLGARAVATASVRDARNQGEFLERASASARVAVEAISGREEARLIHLGVETRWPRPAGRTLIIDIGGGSVEVITSENGRMRDAVSKPLGAVRLWELFLRDDPPSELELRQMEEFIVEKLAGLPKKFGGGEWDRAIATSATASAVVCAIHQVPRTRRDEADRGRVTAAQIQKLYRKLQSLDVASRRKLVGIGPRRAEIIIPGTAVLLRTLREFRMRSVSFSAAGVRDGVIADLTARGVGRQLSQLNPDQRKEAERLSRHYGVSLDHARKVAQLAQALFASLQPLHQLPPAYGKVLEAAAFLHDVGHYVSDTSHHKHSFYLVSNSEMPGFTTREQILVANLCRYHRKALPSAEHVNQRSLTAEERRAMLLLIPLLRLADGLDRSHDQRVRHIECVTTDGQVTIRLEATQDTELERWAAGRAADAFRQIYGRNLEIERVRS